MRIRESHSVEDWILVRMTTQTDQCSANVGVPKKKKYRDCHLVVIVRFARGKNLKMRTLLG